MFCILCIFCIFCIFFIFCIVCIVCIVCLVCKVCISTRSWHQFQKVVSESVSQSVTDMSRLWSDLGPIKMTNEWIGLLSEKISISPARAHVLVNSFFSTKLTMIACADPSCSLLQCCKLTTPNGWTSAGARSPHCKKYQHQWSVRLFLSDPSPIIGNACQ